jgi:hypothetical protein
MRWPIRLWKTWKKDLRSRRMTRIPNQGRKTSWEAIRDDCFPPIEVGKPATSPLGQTSLSEMVATVTLF